MIETGSQARASTRVVGKALTGAAASFDESRPTKAASVALRLAFA
jgi:hypothetical protein